MIKTAVPYSLFKNTGYKIKFATERATRRNATRKRWRELPRSFFTRSRGLTPLLAGPFGVVVLRGGHDWGVRPAGRKAVASICHGVLVLVNSKHSEGCSIIREYLTATLPAKMEQGVYLATRPFLGDYHKTMAREARTLRRLPPTLHSIQEHPDPRWAIVEDEKHNYIGTRYPGDAYLFAEEIIKLIENFSRIW
ncbi:hypothetical protein DL768_007260 [Monosporascus sp. mg162]|nr:hypothetical protein DL768_007260 [Monosporascus sp. mg162]